jgi:hypothetical protein
VYGELDGTKKALQEQGIMLFLMENQMDRACSMYVGEERYIQGSGVETWRKETTWKTQAYMGG